MKKITAILLAAVLIVGLLPVTASAGSSIFGTCGENLTWTLDLRERVLTISGTGPMYDYTEGSIRPWDGNYIDTIRIQEGVTSIGNYAFANSGFGSRWLHVPATVTKIGKQAFASTSLVAWFYGDPPEIAADAFDHAYGIFIYLREWDESKLQSYGGSPSWEKAKIRVNAKTKMLYSLNEEIKAEDFVLEVLPANSGYSSYVNTFTPSQVQIGDYDNSTPGQKQAQILWNGMEFTHHYIVTDGTSHFDEVKVTTAIYQPFADWTLCPPETVTAGTIKLQKDLHYTVSYADNIQVGSDAKVIITGVGEWEGLSKTVTFRILKRNIAEYHISAPSQYFMGIPIYPEVGIPVNGIEQGTDYVLILENNINIGTASYQVVGIGDYYGSSGETFQITDGRYSEITLHGNYHGIAGEELSGDSYYKEMVIAPGPFHGVINSTVDSTVYKHYAYYELYHVEGEEAVLVTTHETELGRMGDTAFDYDFSHVYEGSVENGGEVYILTYSWVDTQNRVFSGVYTLYVPAKVPNAGTMVMEKLQDSGDFRKEYYGAYGPDGDLGEVEWSSSDPSVATVEDGVATLLSPGTVTVTARAGQLTQSMELTVPRRSISDCDFLGCESGSGKPYFCLENVLLLEGTDYTYEYVESSGEKYLVIKGIGLFNGELRFLADTDGERHTHSFEGCTDGFCEICGLRRVAEHAFPEQWQHDSESHWRICGVCGFSQLSEHTMEDRWQHDSETHWKACGVCGLRTEEANHVKTFECNICDYYPQLFPGDITGDGEINNRDVTRLLQYLAGWDVEVADFVMDVNCDGNVNNRDATRLLQYLAGWDVLLG